ncbi:hypothetical protein PR003_g31809 [Phytophthora rubi]|uniref:Uncharacterized protein n=1 Tax=Phytophthora rubi TaxID=129364 RepID=A0A6A3GZ36_9STRA|nr:hypothetical protein PR002_g29757 [Phytophthora rubi]KAE8962115.1 hypothetical protein PR001_g29815 [Phytophthora rubi]KAE9267338.1 hypothetical protein PR003_g31809 [Phytophthora rubi]
MQYTAVLAPLYTLLQISAFRSLCCTGHYYYGPVDKHLHTGDANFDRSDPTWLVR